MKHRIHGVISLVLAVCAFVIGLASVLAESLVTGAFYAALMLSGPVLIIASFCTKCPCREEGCGHILPGMLARYLPRREGPYSLRDLLGMGAPLAGLILFPQPWLWRRKPLWAAFWALFAVALAEIRLCVCTACRNENCPGYPKP